MIEYAHGFRMKEEACDGCLACMRACPTYAIRVKHDKASVQAELCIDCGSCEQACPNGAIFRSDSLPAEWAGFAWIDATWYADPQQARDAIDAAYQTSMAS